MNQIVELVVFISFVILFFIVAVDAFRMRIKAVKLGKELDQYALNYIIISQKLEELIKNQDKKNIEETDGFLKFVSESRDWAFQYIEEVQKTIENLEQAVSKVPPIPQGYRTGEELEDLYGAILKVLKQLPEKSKND